MLERPYPTHTGSIREGLFLQNLPQEKGLHIWTAFSNSIISYVACVYP